MAKFRSKWTTREKEIFHRMFEAGCTYAEIAERLGKPKDTVAKYSKRVGTARSYVRRRNKADTLCWSCDLASGKVSPRTCEQCSWARNLTPVPGWNAEAVAYKSYNGNTTTEVINWRVTKCPSYIPDPL